MQLFRERLAKFLFPAESDNWLALLRIGLGLQVVFYTLSLRTDWNSLFAERSNGLISRELAEAVLAVDSPLVPRLGWLIAAGSRLGLSEELILYLSWAGLLGAGCFLLPGLFCRSAAIVAWFLHLCSVKSGALYSYGMDNFTTIGLFYLMIAPLPDKYSLDCSVRKFPGKNPHRQGFHRRVLQLHLCLIYFFGGLAKTLGIGWWNGTSIWRAMIRPPFNIVPSEILVWSRYLFPILGIAICLVEIGYPFFIWLRQTRACWLVCVLAMHVAIGLTMGLYLFASIMIVLNVAAFGPGLFDPTRRSFPTAQAQTVTF